MANSGGDTRQGDDEQAQVITQRQGNQITGTDEEQPASGLRPALEPEDRDEGDVGHRGDGGGVGNSL